jgi:RNA polymerase sigma-70 factor, ECF subfamily
VDLEAALADVTPRLLAYAFGRTGSRSAAEDVVQDALAALVRRWRRVGPPESVDAFVFAIAKRRATRANVKLALQLPLEVLGSGAAQASLVPERLEHRHHLRGVMHAIAALGRKDREVLLMRAAGEMSIDDIAAALATSSDAVKMRLHRARARLRDRLKDGTHAQR